MLQKLRSNIEAGSYYEAHEMFKTVYHRYRSRRQLEESYKLAEVRRLAGTHGVCAAEQRGEVGGQGCSCGPRLESGWGPRWLCQCLGNS